MSKNQELISVDFQVYCETQFGQIVYICGNLDEFGSWMPIASLRLITDYTLYPKWYSFSPIHIQKNSIIEFKICLLDLNGKLIRWQPLNKNRIVSLNKNCKIILSEGQIQTQFDYQKRGFLAVLGDLKSDSSSSLPYQENYWLNQRYREVVQQFQRDKNKNGNNKQNHAAQSTVNAKAKKQLQLQLSNDDSSIHLKHQQIKILVTKRENFDDKFQQHSFQMDEETKEQKQFNQDQDELDKHKKNIVKTQKKKYYGKDLTPKIHRLQRIISNQSIGRK